MDYSEVTSPTECYMVIAVADIARTTQIAQAMSNREMFEMLSEFYELVSGIVEGSLDATKQLAFKQALRDGRAIQCDEITCRF